MLLLALAGDRGEHTIRGVLVAGGRAGTLEALHELKDFRGGSEAAAATDAVPRAAAGEARRGARRGLAARKRGLGAAPPHARPVDEKEPRGAAEAELLRGHVHAHPGSAPPPVGAGDAGRRRGRSGAGGAGIDTAPREGGLAASICTQETDRQ